MATYFTSDIFQVRQLVQRVKEAVLSKKEVEFTVKKKPQDRSQKKYAHALFNIVAMETGYTREYVKKELFKIRYNPDIFIYDRTNPKTGEITQDLRSSEDPQINLTLAISTFKDGVFVDCGIKLPEPNNKAELERYEYLAQFYQYF